MAGKTWQVASDLPSRLVELRQVLGDSIPEFTERFGRGENQFYQWQKGAQLPPRRVLEKTARAEGWEREMFEEGGKRPAALVNAPVNESGDILPRVLREKPGPGYGVPGAISGRSGSAAADRAQALAGLIILDRLVKSNRKAVPVEEVMGYLAAVVDAAAGRPVTLPRGPETAGEELPPGQTGSG